MTRWLPHRTLCLSIAAFAGMIAHVNPAAAQSADQEPEELTLLVMDPLALQLSCACVDGFGQRRYEALGEYLEAECGMPVEIIWEESLQLAYRRIGRDIDLIIGKDSVVRHDAAATETTIRHLMQLTDLDGHTTLRGAIFVSAASPIQSLAELKGRSLALGPVEDDDVHASIKTLIARGGVVDVEISPIGNIESATYAVADGEVDAASLPVYLPVLMEGCGKIAPGSLRELSVAAPVPFVSVFATARMPQEMESKIVAALGDAWKSPELLVALESREGFLSAADANGQWTDWRGPNRAGYSASVPKQFASEPRVLWRAPLTGPALAGIAATDAYIVVADKDAEHQNDIFRCFSAADGQPVWTVDYEAAGDIDYTNAPRATPVIDGSRVYLQGAWGDLHCVALESGRMFWRRHLLDDFGAAPLTWGCSIPPLIVEDKLIVTPGAPDASVVALDRETGQTLWKTPGHAAAYAPSVVGTFGGVRQIVGYDVAGLAGWDPDTGERLWEVIPPGQADFHVGTPINFDGRLLVASENNGTRVYEFDADGRAKTEPAGLNFDCAPDTCTPVVCGQHIYSAGFGELYCLDRETLETIWVEADDMFFDHTNLIAGDDRVLAWTTTGDLLLIDATADEFHVVSAWRPFGEQDVESMSHPAIVGKRVYLRSQDELLCVELGDE